jgi:branched-chain amino acid transport system permease protein
MSGSEVFLQQLLNGLTIGSYLALIALGYTMVYGIIELINFAHGDVYMMGFFISLSFLGLLGTTAPLTGWALVWVIPVVMGATMVCTGVLNLAIDRLAYKPLRRAPRLAPLITAVGVSFVLVNLAQNWKGPSQVRYPDIFPTVNVLRDLLRLDTQVLFTTKISF